MTRKQLEIDFVVNTGFNKIYIQSAYALPDQVKREQETLSLRKSGCTLSRCLRRSISRMLSSITMFETEVSLRVFWICSRRPSDR